VLQRQGITRTTLRPGDVVIISGAPGRDPGDHRIRMQTIERPADGLSWGKKPDEVVK
jgi:thiamine monophosphate kinase